MIKVKQAWKILALKDLEYNISAYRENKEKPVELHIIAAYMRIKEG